VDLVWTTSRSSRSVPSAWSCARTPSSCRRVASSLRTRGTSGS